MQTAPRPTLVGAAPRQISQGVARRRTQARLAYLFIAPAFIMLLIFQYYPSLSAIYHALTAWDAASPPVFVGLANFQSFFSDPVMGTAVANILKLTVFWMVLAVTVPLVAARLIRGVESARLQFIYRLCFILPFVVPTVVNILLWQFIYAGGGVLNQVLSVLHLNRLALDW